MPRSEITVGDSSFLETHDLVKIILRTGEVCSLGSARVVAADPDTGNPVEYQPMLSTVGESRQSLRIAIDKIPLAIQNIDRIFGMLINDAETQLAGAECQFIKYLSSIDGASEETHVIMRGEITGVVTNQNDVTFTLVADLSTGQANIGGQQLGAKCPLTFGGYECGWEASQGGDPTFCDKQYLSGTGCSGHHNQHRYQGIVPGGDLTDIVISPGGGIGNEGNLPIGHCFLEGTEITMANGFTTPIENITVGNRVRSFAYDVETNQVKGYVNRQVIRVQPEKFVDFYYEINFSNDCKPVNVAEGHPFLSYKDGQNEWILAQHISPDVYICGDDWILYKVESVKRIDKRVRVYNFSVEATGTYIANNKLVHNTKPILGGDGYPIDWYPTQF